MGFSPPPKHWGQATLWGPITAWSTTKVAIEHIEMNGGPGDLTSLEIRSKEKNPWKSV